MSLNVSGSCQVYKVQDKGNYVTASLRTSKKDRDGEWQSEFYNAKFVGKDTASAAKLEDKEKITLNNAILESVKGKDGKTYINVVVFEFTLGAVQPYTANEEDSSDIPF
jgi:ribosomal protein L18